MFNTRLELQKANCHQSRRVLTNHTDLTTPICINLTLPWHNFGQWIFPQARSSVGWRFVKAFDSAWGRLCCRLGVWCGKEPTRKEVQWICSECVVRCCLYLLLEIFQPSGVDWKLLPCGRISVACPQEFPTLIIMPTPEIELKMNLLDLSYRFQAAQ